MMTKEDAREMAQLLWELDETDERLVCFNHISKNERCGRSVEKYLTNLEQSSLYRPPRCD